MFIKTKYAKAKLIDSATASPKNLSDKQIAMYSAKLARNPEFAREYAPVGMTTENFVGWIEVRLPKIEYQKNWAIYLKQVGYAGGLMS